jgi:hypothetical protein
MFAVLRLHESRIAEMPCALRLGFLVTAAVFCGLAASAGPLPPDATYRPLPTQSFDQVKADDEAARPQIMGRTRRNLRSDSAFNLTAMIRRCRMAEEGLARGQDRDDEQIAEAINDRLLQDGGLAGVQIQVSANEATLTGDVESQEARDRAEAIAAAVAGVRYVINNLRVGQEGTTGATG